MSGWFPFPNQDAVEKEFQTSFVKLDNMLHEFYTKNKDNEAFIGQVRSHVFNMVKAFTNLETLAQTVHQENLKYEALMLDMRHEVSDYKKELAVLEKEAEVRIVQLHETSTGDQLNRFDNLAEQQRMLVEREAWLNAHLEESNKENTRLHDELIRSMKDLGGCKVTIKYMDKEIIGRIQQLQLMQQGLDKPPNTLTWNTIEAEICLNRHKAVIHAHSMRHKGVIKKCPYRKGMVRTILLHRGSEGLGLSITGGADHRAPIIISAIHPGKPADKFGGLYVGDAIVVVNDIDLRGLSHAEAVKILSSCGDELILKVAHVAGYDDEHRLEKAPILEIDPIPELQNRNDNPGLERLQAGKFLRENTLGERSSHAGSATVEARGTTVVNAILAPKHGIQMVSANSIDNMKGSEVTEPCKPLEYYMNGDSASIPKITIPSTNYVPPTQQQLEMEEEKREMSNGRDQDQITTAPQPAAVKIATPQPGPPSGGPPSASVPAMSPNTDEDQISAPLAAFSFTNNDTVKSM